MRVLLIYSTVCLAVACQGAGQADLTAAANPAAEAADLASQLAAAQHDPAMLALVSGLHTNSFPSLFGKVGTPPESITILGQTIANLPGKLAQLQRNSGSNGASLAASYGSVAEYLSAHGATRVPLTAANITTALTAVVKILESGPAKPAKTPAAAALQARQKAANLEVMIQLFALASRPAPAAAGLALNGGPDEPAPSGPRFTNSGSGPYKPEGRMAAFPENQHRFAMGLIAVPNDDNGTPAPLVTVATSNHGNCVASMSCLSTDSPSEGDQSTAKPGPGSITPGGGGGGDRGGGGDGGSGGG